MIKKISFTILLAVIIQLSASSQVRSEKFFAGGSLGFNYSNSDRENNLTISSASKITSISTSIIGGFFITERLAGGLDLEYNITNSVFENSPIEYTNSSNILIAPLVRYYIFSGLFTQGQFNFGQSEVESKLNIPESNDVGTFSYLTLGYGIGVGYDMPIKKNIYIEPMLRYISNKENEKDSDNSNMKSSIFFNLGIIISL
jgi:hypothetical protein